MFFDEIIYGTQYYRAPTPLPTEWEKDLANMEFLSLDTIQIRVQWRKNEPKENEYFFDDVDELFALSQKYNLKVVFKFLLECAPQYIYDKYHGTRINPDGTLIRSGSHGAYYIGGWLPCFINPDVKNAAIRFVEVFSRRYAKQDNLILWNVWNEPTNRPIGECYCEHCRQGFGNWLKGKFDSIEKLNDYFGVAEESFETIALPAMTQGYWDIFMFKKWKSGEALCDNLRFVYEGIKKHDVVRPIMSHVGSSSAVQVELGDLSNDYVVSKAVDFYGASFPTVNMDAHTVRIRANMMIDFMRSVDKNFFIHELYPGIGMFWSYDKRSDLMFKLWTILAGGAKGIVFWQYRAERLGCESDCAGIVNMNGSLREISHDVKEFGAMLKTNMDLFMQSEPVQAQIAIVFDYDSMLLSFIEDGTDELYSFDRKDNPICYYTKAHRGMYELFRDMDYSVDYLNSADMEEFHKYKVLYFPYYSMANPNLGPFLKKFVENGGIVLADEGFGMRQLNTWIQIDPIIYKDIMDVQMNKRRFSLAENKICIGEEEVTVSPYKTDYICNNAKALFKFNDGENAISEFDCEKGKVVLFGSSIGYSYNMYGEKAWVNWLDGYLTENSSIKKEKYSDVKNNIYVRKMQTNDHDIYVIFNWSDKTKEIIADNCIIPVYGFDHTDENLISIKPLEVICFMASR